MNSLPLISHRLFVAAIGNENCGHERPTGRDRAFAGVDGYESAAALEVPDSRKPTEAEGARRASRPGIIPARA